MKREVGVNVELVGGIEGRNHPPSRGRGRTCIFPQLTSEQLDKFQKIISFRSFPQQPRLFEPPPPPRLLANPPPLAVVTIHALHQCPNPLKIGREFGPTFLSVPPLVAVLSPVAFP